MRIPLTVEIVYFKAPLFLRLQLVEGCLEIAAVWTVRCEELDEFEAGIIALDLVVELLVADEVGIGHVPLFAAY